MQMTSRGLDSLARHLIPAAAVLTAASLGLNWHVLFPDPRGTVSERGWDIQPLGSLLLTAAATSLVLVLPRGTRGRVKAAARVGLAATVFALAWQLVADAVYGNADDVFVSTGSGYLALALGAGLYGAAGSTAELSRALALDPALPLEGRSARRVAALRLTMAVGITAVYVVLNLLGWDHLAAY